MAKTTPVPEVPTTPAPAQLAPPHRVLLLTGAALACGVIIAIALARSSYEKLEGYLQAVSMPVHTPHTGRLSRILVRPGQVVSLGEPLFELTNANLVDERDRLDRMVTELKAELQQAKARATIELADRRARLEDAIFDTKLKSAVYLKQEFQDRVAQISSEQDLPEGSLFTHAVAQGGAFPPPLSIPPAVPAPPAQESPTTDPRLLTPFLNREVSRQAVEVAKTQVKLCDERIEMLHKQLEQISHRIDDSLGIPALQVRLETAEQDLRNVTDRPCEVSIVAPRYGTVGLMTRQAGEPVASLEVLCELFDADQPSLTLTIPTTRLADFPPGLELTLVFPGNQHRVGVVQEPPPQTTHVPRWKDSLPADAGTIRLTLRPRGQLWPQIPFGSQIEVRRSRW